MRRLSTCVSIALLLAACGGGGGSGDIAQPPQRAGIQESYYPVGTGSHWTYEVTSSTAGAYMDDLMVAGTRAVSGINAWVFAESNPAGNGIAVQSYFAKDARSYTYLGNNHSTAWLDSLITPIDLMRFDGTFGASPLLKRSNVLLDQDLDGDHLMEHADLVVTGTVEANETLVTNMGSFSNTARLRYDVTGTIRLSTGATLPFIKTLREWRAPGLGTLRQSTHMLVSGTEQSEQLDARGLAVNGVVAGILAPHELLANLAGADSDITHPGQPAVASDGTHYLLVTDRQTPSGWQSIGQFIGPDGQPLNSVTFALGAYPWGPPSVAWNGSQYLLVAGAGGASGVQAQLVGSDGIAGLRRLLAPDGNNQALAAGGGIWLVVYARDAIQGSLFGRFVQSSGVPGNEFTIATGVANATAPAVAFNGQNFIVVWESRLVSGDPSTSNIYATQVFTAGTTSGPVSVSTATEAQSWPQIACGLQKCLVTWVDRRNYPGQSYSYSPGPGDIYAALLTPEGPVLKSPSDPAGIPIALGISSNVGYPSLVYAGSEYIAAWSSGAYANNPGDLTGIYAARISNEGIVTTGATALTASTTPESATRYVYPVLAVSSSGTLAAWLKNSELTGTNKSIAGTVIWPKVLR